MARGYEVAVGADGRAFERAVRNDVVKPVEDAARALDELGAAGDDAGREASRGLDKVQDGLRDVDRASDGATRSLDKVSDGLRDVGREGDRAGDESARSLGKLEQALRDAERQSKKTETAVDDIGTGGSHGLGKLSEGASEVTSEIGSNLSEAVSSVRDNLADLGQVGQDTLGGLAGTLAGTGPAGIAGAAVLAAGAVGLGRVTAELEKQQEEADRLKDRLRSAYQEASQEGRDYLEVSQLIADANDLMFNPDRAEEYKKLQEDAKTLHLDQSLLIRANAGDLEAQKVVQGEVNKLLEDEGSYMEGLRGDHEVLKGSVQGLRDRWKSVTDATEEQRQAAQNSRKVTSEFLLSAASQAKSATAEVDKFGNQLIKLPDGTEFVIDAKTGQAHQDMDRFYGDADDKIEKLNRKDVRVRLRVDDSEVRSWRAPVKTGTIRYGVGRTAV